MNKLAVRKHAYCFRMAIVAPVLSVFFVIVGVVLAKSPAAWFRDESWLQSDKTLVLDLMSDAPNAVWSSGAGRLLFNGSRDDSRGFAKYEGGYLENAAFYERVLETHPRWRPDGWIRGEYYIPSVESGQHFLADVGFIMPAGSPRTNGVEISIIFNRELIGETIKYYTGELLSIDVDLTEFDGQSGMLVLEVSAHGDSTQDWLVWLNPRIAVP